MVTPTTKLAQIKFRWFFQQHYWRAGIGGLICDPFGKLLMAYTAEVRATLPLEAELLALQRGLFHANELGFQAIQIEGDCLALVTTVQHSATMSWDLMPTWQRTMNMIASLNTWSIHYCKRTTNGVANLWPNMISLKFWKSVLHCHRKFEVPSSKNRPVQRNTPDCFFKCNRIRCTLPRLTDSERGYNSRPSHQPSQCNSST